MSSGKKYPGSALHRATGAEREYHVHRDFQDTAYATGTDLQRRYLMRRYGLGPRQAGLIAALFFGEDRK